MQILIAKSRITSHCGLRGLDQQHPHESVPLFADRTEPLMSFPPRTVFTPYSVLRNTSSQPISVRPALYWMEGAGARSANLSPFTVLPNQTANLDVMSMTAQAGLRNFNGSVNLVFEVPGALLQ
jgi:hypothetical protein